MRLKDKIETGGFALLAEMEPPKGVDVTQMVTGAKRVKGDIDAFLVPEMSNAVMRMSSLGGAMVLAGNGLETVVQFNCRDRNRIALQADLLSAHACGIANVMAVTGEDPAFGDHHKARAVNDIDLLELLTAIKTLETGRDMAGIELSGTPSYFKGATVDAGAKGKSPELEVEELNRKMASGAEFFITPPLFDPPVLEPFLKRVDTGRVKMIPTVLLLKSVGMARYVARNMPHIHMPDTLIARIQQAGDKTRECVLIAAETISTIKKIGLSGALISTMGWEHKLPEIISRI